MFIESEHSPVTTLTIRVSPKEKTMLRMLADMEKTTVSGLVRRCIASSFTKDDYERAIDEYDAPVTKNDIKYIFTLRGGRVNAC